MGKSRAVLSPDAVSTRRPSELKTALQNRVGVALESGQELADIRRPGYAKSIRYVTIEMRKEYGRSGPWIQCRKTAWRKDFWSCYAAASWTWARRSER